MCRVYTEEMDKFLLENCKGKTIYELADMLNSTFGTSLTSGSIKSRKAKIGARSELLLHKETHPALKSEKSQATRFKKGNIPPLYKPIGSERVKKDGYVQIKVSKDKWEMKNRFVYEEHYGKLNDNEDVIFLDGDKTNFDISNLMKVTHNESFKLNINGLRTNDKELTKVGVGIVKLDNAIKNKTKTNADRKDKKWNMRN